MRSAKEKPVTAIGTVHPPGETDAFKLSKRTANVRAWIEAMPATEGRAFAPGKNWPPLAIMYKVMGKIFAISVRPRR